LIFHITKECSAVGLLANRSIPEAYMRKAELNQIRLIMILGLAAILSVSGAISDSAAQPSTGLSGISNALVADYPVITIQDKQCVPARYCYRNRYGRLICRIRERCRQCEYVRRCETGIGCNWVERCRWVNVFR